MMKRILLLMLVLFSVEGYAETTFGIHYTRSFGEGKIRIGSAKCYETHIPQGGGFLLLNSRSEIFGFAATGTILRVTVGYDSLEVNGTKKEKAMQKQLLSFGAGVSVSNGGSMTLIFMPTMMKGINFPSKISSQ